MENINTKGATYDLVVAQLSETMTRRFDEALADLENIENRKLVQAVYDVFNQAYSLGVTKTIDDEAILRVAGK